MRSSPDNSDKAVLLLTYRNNDEAEEACTLLNREGIPAFIDSYYSNELLGKLVDVGGARLMVPNNKAAQAVERLRKNEKEIPHPEQSTIGLLDKKITRLPLLRNVPEPKKKSVFLLLVSLLLLALIILTYLFTKDLP